MSPFVMEVVAVSRPIFLEAVGPLRDVTPVIESTDTEVRLTMHGRSRNGRDIGIRLYQLEGIIRLITTLEPITHADVLPSLRPALRYASTPEWLTIRAEATGFDHGEEHFESVLAELLAQILGTPPKPREPVTAASLRAALPDAVEDAGALHVNTGSFSNVAAEVSLRPREAWVQATTRVAGVSLSQTQCLRMNDYTTFFRIRQRDGLLVLEGELPAALADATGLRWLATQIAMTARAVGRNLSLVAEV